MNNSIVIFSSSRRHGNTGKLVDSINANINGDVLDLDDYDISPYDYQHRNKNDDFLPLINKILSYNSIVFASPIYWYSVPPAMKTFIDRISDLLTIPELLETGRKLRGKNAYVLCTSSSENVSEVYINAFKQTFAYLGLSYRGYLHANCADGYNTDDELDKHLFFQSFNKHNSRQ
jgi:multimeric flavodoxin WrbA